MLNLIFNRLINQIKIISTKSKLIDKLLSQNFLLKLAYFYAGLKLKQESARCKNTKQCIDIALNYQYSLLKNSAPIIVLSALQKEREISKFCKLIAPMRPKAILEIGTANGGTLFLLSKFSAPDSLIISVDLPVGPFIGGINYKTSSFYKAFTSHKQKMVLISRDSHKPSTLEKVKKNLKKKQLDILFIDGDHSYEGVKQDFEMYSPLVKKKGIIAFHDIVVVPEENVEVNKFWNEIKKNYEYFEYVEDWNQGNCGIGVIISN